MARKYVSRCTVLIDGTKVQHLKNFKWADRRYREQIKLMDGVGTIDTLPDQTFSLDYAIPKSSAILDWSGYEDVTVIVILTGGGRVIFSGVDSLGEGEMTVDGEREPVRPITFSYEDVVVE